MNGLYWEVMAIRKIVGIEHPALRKKALKVSNYDAKFQELVDNMVETLNDAPGVGLAAPQVAVSQRLIVVRLSDDEESKKEYGAQAGVLYVVANPKIIKASKEMVEGTEGCLSIPGYYGDVERHKQVVVTGNDRRGADIRIKADGWLARVFQHEIDHLDGRLFTDLAKDLWRVEKDENGTEKRHVRVRRRTDANSSTDSA
jgi:peptide deformylase